MKARVSPEIGELGKPDYRVRRRRSPQQATAPEFHRVTSRLIGTNPRKQPAFSPNGGLPARSGTYTSQIPVSRERWRIWRREGLLSTPIADSQESSNGEVTEGGSCLAGAVRLDFVVLRIKRWQTQPIVMRNAVLKRKRSCASRTASDRHSEEHRRLKHFRSQSGLAGSLIQAAGPCLL